MHTDASTVPDGAACACDPRVQRLTRELAEERERRDLLDREAEDAANVLGKIAGTLRDFVTGKQPNPDAALSRIADAIGVPFDDERRHD